MPEISEQDFQDLKDRVQALANQLNQARNRIDELEDFATDHIGLDWGESLVDINAPHPNISVNTIESGGGTIRQDANGMQVKTLEEDTAAIYFVRSLAPNPSTAAVSGYIQGNISDTASAIGIVAQYATDPGNQSLLTVDSNTDGDHVVTVDESMFVLNGAISPAQLTGNTDNYDPAGNREASAFRLSSDAARDITGIVVHRSARVLFVLNAGSFNIVLKDESGLSAASSRFALAGDITLAPNNSALLWHDGNSDRWRCVARYT